VDLKIGGAAHDIRNVEVKNSILQAIVPTKRRRCRAVVISIPCKTWSAVHFLPDANGKPGRPWRDVDHFHGIPRDGSIPQEVTDADLESTHAAEIALAVVEHGGGVMAETPARRNGPKAIARHVLADCKRAVHMFDHPAWRHFAERTDAVEHAWDQCKHVKKPS
jgi:hypothetical protein